MIATTVELLSQWKSLAPTSRNQTYTAEQKDLASLLKEKTDNLLQKSSSGISHLRNERYESAHKIYTTVRNQYREGNATVDMLLDADATLAHAEPSKGGRFKSFSLRIQRLQSIADSLQAPGKELDLLKVQNQLQTVRLESLQELESLYRVMLNRAINVERSR